MICGSCEVLSRWEMEEEDKLRIRHFGHDWVYPVAGMFLLLIWRLLFRCVPQSLPLCISLCRSNDVLLSV